jgi:phenylacetaldehyde dehydrogenase
MTPSERGRIIWRIGDLILEHAKELAQLESLDNGKPYAVALGADVPLAADLFHYMAGWATKIEGNSIKPAEQTPLTALRLAGLIAEAGCRTAW